MQHTIKLISPILVFFILWVLLFLRKKKRRSEGGKDAVTILILIFMVPAIVISMLPFENNFISFKSPESAAKYFVGNYPVTYVSERGNDRLTVVKTKSGDDFLYLRLRDGKYSSPMNNLDFKTFYAKQTDCFILEMRVPGTKKYWFAVQLREKPDTAVADSLGAVPEVYRKNDSSAGMLIYAENIGKEYYISVGDEKIYPKS